MDILKTITSALAHSTTYGVGRRQAKAYVILMRETTEALKEFGIIPKEWALLGLLSEKGRMRPTDIADELGVEPAYVTALVSNLKKLKLAEEATHAVDTRAKVVHLTPKGESFVKKTEPMVRSRMRPFIEGVEMRDLLGYITVIEHIIIVEANKNKL